VIIEFTTEEGIDDIPYRSLPYISVVPASLQRSCRIEPVITQTNQRESNNSRIQRQPKHVIKESCDKTLIILWERDVPPYYINGK
jgi:hypothetical protein